MQNKIRLFLVLFLALSHNLFGDETFKDFLIQSPKISKPQRGSLKGDFAELGVNALNERSGSFVVDLPLSFPTERGSMQFPFKISYSAGFGFSEFGIGFDSALKINRFRELGKLNFSDDDVMSPWGHLVLGNDGFWYSKDLRSKIRAKLNGSVFCIYLPDGTVAVFGDSADNVYTEKTNTNQIYGWYLKKTYDQQGHTTTYSYKKFQVDGKAYLDKIYYGGLNQNFQYQVEFLYEQTKRDFTDFTLSKKLVKNRRVSRINVNAFEASAFQNRYYFNFTYADSTSSPSFYLSSLQKFYSTGGSEPLVSLTYDLPSEYLAKAVWEREPALDNMADTFRGLLTNLNQSSFQDFNNDGFTDIEVGKGYQEFQNNNGTFVERTLPAPTGTVSSWCLFPVYNDRKPRKFIQLHQDNTEPYVFDFFTYNSKNLLEVCSLNGERVTTIQFPYFWEYGQKTIFADINGDGLTDVIHLRGDAYEVSYNTSDPHAGGQVSFAAPSAPVQINLPSTYSSFWIMDINGDGHGDLILKGDSTIYVHYGHADGTFEKNFVTFDFYLPNGSISSKNLSDAQVSWVDVNKDSLPDILLQGDGFITLYENTGSGFVNTYVPGLFANPQLYQNMVVANLTGKGDTQILSSIRYSKQNFVLKLDLDRPSLGMMTSLYDGKGNELKLEYKKATAQEGVGTRKTVLSKMIKKTAGKSPVSNNFNFFNIKKHTVNNNFLGFKDIEIAQDNLGKAISNYDYDTQNLNRLVSKLHYDISNPTLVRYEETEYVDKIFGNVTFPMPLKKTTGMKSNDGSQKSTVTTEYSYDDETLCTLGETKTSSTQTLQKATSYYSLEKFANHFSCLEKEIELNGSGGSSNETYAHKLELVRDDSGRVVEVKKGINQTTSLQSIVYGQNGLISSLNEAGKGTTQFYYDSNFRLNKVINPDLIENTIAAFNPLNDQPLNLNLKRGSLSFENQFRYDPLARLLKNWDNLGAFSETNPQVSYDYVYAGGNAPGKVFQKSSVEKKSGTFGDSQQILLKTGADEELATIAEVEGAFRVQGLTDFHPDTGTNSKIKDYLLSGNFNFTTMTMDDLNFTNEKLGTTKNDFLGILKFSSQSLQTGINKNMNHVEIVSNGDVLQSDVVNNDPNLLTQKRVDGFGHLTKFTNEENKNYQYTHDSLGRIVQITFPDNSKQTVTYDQDLGAISRVERENIGAIEYSYNLATTLLSQKRRYDRLGVLQLREDYTYDLIGRVLTKILTQVNSDGTDGSSTTYTYSYDGLNLSAPERVGQEGFLTGVSSSAYSKSFVYRPDGKILRSTVSIPGFREFKAEFTYLSHGAVESRIQTVKNLTTNGVESNYTLMNEYDRFGNILRLKHNGNFFAHFLYDEFGQVSNIDLVGKKTIHYSYDDLTRESRNYDESYNGKTIFNQSWNYNNRGLIGSDLFKIDTREIAKNYAYSPRGFLSAMNRTDSDGPGLLTGHSYDSNGLMSSESKDGTNISHTIGLNQWIINGVVYDIDTLGRVVKKDNRIFTYGENGRISHVSGSGVNEADYVYDEENNPILKIYKFGKIAVYLGDNAYVDDNFYEPMKVGNRIVGYFNNGVFVSSSQDHLNTNVVDENGVVNLATPYGERNSRSDVNEVLDFTLKGFDSDIDAVRMGHRYYDPMAKRFYSADEFFLENSEKVVNSPIEGNLYSYAGNDPVSKLDPSGREVYSFSRPLESDTGDPGIGRHQFTVAIPDKPEDFNNLVDIGGGKKGVVIGAYNVNGKLEAKDNAPSDLEAAKKYFNNASSSIVASKVEHKGLSDTGFINKILDKAQAYSDHSKNMPINYPSTFQNLLGIGTNSNSFNQSLLRESGGTNTSQGFTGYNSGESKKIDASYFKEK